MIHCWRSIPGPLGGDGEDFGTPMWCAKVYQGHGVIHWEVLFHPSLYAEEVPKGVKITLAGVTNGPGAWARAKASALAHAEREQPIRDAVCS